MNKFLSASLAALLLGIGAAPARAQYGWACTRDYPSSVNLRNGPSRGYSVIASIPTGSPVRYLSWVYGGDNRRWYRVESSGIVGFAREDYLCP